MANGKPSDPEKYVIRYGVRSGLKREFAFALKSQADLPNSLGRTRSGKAAANPAAAASPGGKRPRNYDARDELKKFLKPLPDAVVILALSAGTPMERDTAAMDFSAVGATKEGYPKNGVDAQILEYGKEGLEKDDESSDAPGSNERLEKEMPLVEKPIVIYRRSASKIKPEYSLTSTPQAPPPPSSTEPEAVKLELPHDNVKYKVSNSQLKIGSVLENPMVSKGYNVTRISNGVAEKPIRRFTRSALKLMSVVTTPDTIKQEEKPSEVEPVSVAPVAVEQDEKLSEVEPVSVAPLAVEQEGKLSEVEPVTVAPLAVEQEGKLSEVEPVSVAPLVVEQEESLVEIPIIVDEIGGLEFQSGQVEASIKDELEGSVSVTLITEDEKDEMDEINDGAQFEKLSRRFTKPSLKVAAEDSTGADASTTTSIDSVESEELKGDSDALVGSLSMTSKNKMELKMSKKITLTKLPSNVRDLLGTGLLEGMPVKYISCIGKSVGLQGVIRGNGVLCSCISCKGTKVVSAYQFEIHAGSTKKHPSDFIFLQNGKSLRDVLKSCTGAPLDMLEAAIQNAIGLAPPKKLFVCQKCKEIFDTARIGFFALLCDTCLETSHQQSTPPSSYRTVISAKLPRKVLMPSPSDGVPKNPVSQKKPSYGKLTRKDLGLHKLVFMDDILPQGTEVGYYIRGKRLLEGYIKDLGIFCRCCNCVVSPSQFEAHAGQASRRKPYNNIYTSNGVSLHELSVSLSKGRKLSPTENDDLCGICADGGDLLLCDLCPRAFHKECVGLSSIPTGDWFCQYCQNLRLKEKYLAHNDNAIAAGRVAGVDPIEQIIKRCIRIVTAPDNDATVCALCREHDFSRFGFDRRTVIICDQCETEYHVGCLKDHDMADLKDLPEGEWFCRPDCSRIRSSLRDLLCQGSKMLEELDADIIKKKLSNDAAIDIKWRLLSGKDDSADSKLLLSQAVSIFRESFDPIVEPISGRDLIPYMVYGRNMRDQDFGGMYCMVLTLNSSVVSAGLLRVLGCEVGELPLVATERESQGRGYFQALFSCIERLFESLNVKHFVLPAADEAESIWTKKLGFAKLTPAQLREYAKGARPMIFHGTSMLHKPVLYHQEPVLVSDENTSMPPA